MFSFNFRARRARRLCAIACATLFTTTGAITIAAHPAVAAPDPSVTAPPNPGTPSRPNHDVSGRVVDASGKAVSGITVTAADGSGSAVTGADGRFQIANAFGSDLTVSRGGVTIATIKRAGQDIVVTLPAALRTIGRTSATATSKTAAGEVATTNETGLLGSQSVYKTPYSVDSFTDTMIDNAQARSLSDIVTNDPAVRVVASAYGDTELLAIRGFDYLPAATLFDGLSGLVNVTRPPLDGIQRIDIFKGPSALLDNDSGSSAVGGSMNFVPKRAGDRPNESLELYGLPFNDAGAHLDIGQRFGTANEFGVRINVDGRSGATPIEGQHDDFSDETLGADYRHGGTVASVDYVREQHTILGLQPSIAVPEGIAIPAAPDDASDFFDRSTLFTTSSSMVALRLQQRLSANISFDLAYGHRILQSVYDGADLLTLTDAKGDATAVAYPYYVRQNDDAAHIGVRVRAKTGPLHHEFALAIDDADHPNKNTFSFNAASATTNIYDPVALGTALPPVPPNQTAALTMNSREHSVALADVITSGRLTLIGGARHQFIDQQAFDPATGDLLTDAPTAKYTPSLAGLYEIGSGLSVYANYIEQLSGGNIAPPTAVNAGEQFPAFAARQTEVGAKADLGRYGATLAAFSIFEPIAITNPTTNVFSQAGLQRNEGLEFSLFGNVTPHIHTIAGLALTKGVQLVSADGTTNGLPAIGVPNFESNLNVDVDVPSVPGLGLNGRMITTSHQTLDLENTQGIPSWATFQVGTSYAARGRDTITTTRFAIENLTNLHYWASARDSALALGFPRTYRLSVTVAGR